MIKLTTMLTLKNIESGTHFWAKVDGQIAVVIKDSKQEYFLCGGWECAVMEDEIELISVIPIPEGFDKTSLYYL